MFFSLLAKLFIVLLPWPLRRHVLTACFGYKIHPSCRIGLSWVFPKELLMEEKARVGHLTVVKGLQLLHLGPYASLGNLNWITGFPKDLQSSFQHMTDRKPVLLLERHSAVTHRHLIDCTDQVTIGEFSTLAGFHSQILTHAIDLEASRQSSSPVSIGRYCFIGTKCLLLDGASLPDCSVLAAGSVLNKAYAETNQLYAGVPAKPVKTLPSEYGYFSRTTGFVS